MYQANSLAHIHSSRRNAFLVPVSILMAVVLFSLLLIAWASGSLTNPFHDAYLLPWTALAGVTVAAPLVYLAMRGHFDLFNPIVFAAWSYFIPSFVIGGLLLSSGVSQPFYLTLISDPTYYLPLTLVYVALGFAGLAAGFFIPTGGALGRALSAKLPAWDWTPEEVLVPAVGLLLIGVLISFSALALGVIGYQRSAIVDVFDATLYFFSQFATVATFIIWFAIFKVGKLDLRFKLALGFMVLFVPSGMLVAGNRGGLVSNIIPIAVAFWLSGRRIKLRHGILLGTMLTVALLIGMIYGTTFRNLKGTEERISVDQYVSLSGKTVELIQQRSFGENMEFALTTLAERMEATSALAVIVANHEQLSPYEAGYGLADNIWLYTWTAFIPRLIWPEKPLISDARAFSDLYFSYGDNSFQITPIGDLLRTYGPISVPIGMALLGFVLRILYATFIEGQKVTAGRAAAYCMLLLSVSYEGFYGTILPGLIRVSFVVLVSCVVLNLIIGKRRGRRLVLA